MRLRAEAKDPASVEANVLAVPIYKEDDPFADDLANLDAAAGGVIRGYRVGRLQHRETTPRYRA